MESIVDCAVYAKGKRVKELALNEVGSVLNSTNKFVWLRLKDPNEKLMTTIQELFGLHELAIEDAHRAHQRPKFESYGDTYYIVLRTIQPNQESQHLNFGETHFFLGKNFIISIRHRSKVTFDDVRMRCEATPHLLEKGSGFVLYAVMDFIVDQYFPIMELLEEDLDKLETRIFKEKYRRDTPARIYRMRGKIIEIKKAISPLIDICNKLMRNDAELIDEEIRNYFRDVYDHAIRMNEMLDSTKEQLSTALEANFSLTSINQNEVSKRFAGWAAIIGVPTMIAGIYGMNFANMPELRWEYGYPMAIGLIVVSCSTLFYFFRKSGWL
ncbi:MAG: magnesium/cobalt transporter CorA [Bacteroidales bacterium]|nr:magnesium/cobalt transporter CorA [Bacteroidales bacterium]